MEIYIPIIIAIIASLPGIYAAVNTRKKEVSEAENYTAQAAKTIQASAMELVMQYKQRIEELERMVKELTERIEILETELSEAHTEIKRLENINKGINRKIAGFEK